MAWEPIERDGNSGFTGDQPLDELSAALKRIAAVYDERFGRKPTLAETLYNLERLLQATPQRYVADSDGLECVRISTDRKAGIAMTAIDPDRFEGVYAESPPEYQVVRRDAARKATTEVVIAIPTLDTNERVLVCEYRRLAAELDANSAEQLIIQVVLRELLIDRRREDADTVEFHDLATGARHVVPYP